ncbi:hypothetical protein Z945_551 [Sulfitobacter noctilucae]|uniref:hypothetical protein n=1 Tax=Sulfitobacter noctilucae TaxID=1342302 RepID=UPI000469E6D0|nr:hypothetical protein [Sulfitobacter noctilucae]KIN65508.1 hypothetical protein Z945_551 [Sulfitobacter noctilucae]
MNLAVIFAVFFIGGPLGFRMLTRRGEALIGQRALAACIALLAAGGLILRYGFADLWGRHFALTVVSILLIWFAWIGVLAYGARALRHVDRGLAMRRWTGVIGAAGTTMPWFGLASADMFYG